MPRVSFQAKLFLAGVSAAVLTLAVAGLLFARTLQRQTDARVEQTLKSEARVASELLARMPGAVDGTDVRRTLDAEADRLGALLTARVTFIGDDDLWMFINGKLAIDLGGLHPPDTQTVNLDAEAANLGIVKGQVYPMDIFHAERHSTGSNFRIDTTIGCFVPQ